MKMVPILIGLMAWFFALSAQAQKLQWSYEQPADFPVAYDRAVLNSVEADTAGGAVFLIDYLGSTSAPDGVVGTRVVWVSSTGKVRFQKDFTDWRRFRVMKVLPTAFYLRLGDDITKFQLKSNQVTEIHFAIEVGDKVLDELNPAPLADANGFFIRKIGVSSEFVQLRRYRF